MIPNHIAIILDGNGRWAKAKGMPRSFGHLQGAKNVEIICEEAYKAGVKFLTFYAFSVENWKRPKDEVETLMKILRDYLKTCLKTADKNRIRVRVIGDKQKLAPDIVKSIDRLEEHTKGNDGLRLQIAINYGSRDEITRCFQKLAHKLISNELHIEDVSEEAIGAALDTAGIPDPDLLIRTSGEQRLSNFLLWQLSYTEMYFTKIHWPDFTKEELFKAIGEYSNRNRRYGGV